MNGGVQDLRVLGRAAKMVDSAETICNMLVSVRHKRWFRDERWSLFSVSIRIVSIRNNLRIPVYLVICDSE